MSKTPNFWLSYKKISNHLPEKIFSYATGFTYYIAQKEVTLKIDCLTPTPKFVFEKLFIVRSVTKSWPPLERYVITERPLANLRNFPITPLPLPKMLSSQYLSTANYIKLPSSLLHFYISNLKIIKNTSTSQSMRITPSNSSFISIKIIAIVSIRFYHSITTDKHSITSDIQQLPHNFITLTKKG